MNLTVFGATGPTGIHLVDQALAAGHRVTVLVRDPARLTTTAGAVTVVQGDATDPADVRTALTGADAVVSALGPGGMKFSAVASGFATALIPAARETGVDRVVIMSALGVGDTRRYLGPLQRLGVKLVLGRTFDDKARADELVRASGLDWTLVYPVTLTDGPGTGSCTAVERPSGGGAPKISRADVAGFMLREAAGGEWSRRTAVLLP